MGIDAVWEQKGFIFSLKSNLPMLSLRKNPSVRSVAGRRALGEKSLPSPLKMRTRSKNHLALFSKIHLLFQFNPQAQK
jgi:hypothetical protein